MVKRIKLNDMSPNNLLGITAYKDKWKEDDIRKYWRCNPEQIVDLINTTIEDYNNKANFTECKRTNTRVYAVESGDTMVEIVEGPEEIELTVYEVKRHYAFNK